jgi:hypothetical protein
LTDARDLVHPRTAKQMASLTPKAYRGVVAAAVRSSWYKLSTDLSYLDEAKLPLETLLEELTVRSGSVGGEHRRDVRDAIMGPSSQTGFSLVAPPGEPAKPAEAEGKKKGYW